MALFSAGFPLRSRAVSAVFEPPAARRTRDPVEKVCFPETCAVCYSKEIFSLWAGREFSWVRHCASAPHNASST